MRGLQVLSSGRERGGRTGLPANRRLPAVYRVLDGESGEVVHGELARDAPLALVEAALTAADEPLSAKRLATACGLADAAEVRRLVQRLQALYDRDGTAFQVGELAGGYQLLTRPEYHPWLARLRRTAAELRLSPAARETLAIVAYRQPITRADVESIRGVGSSDVLAQLMEKGLVRIAGREESLGRPMLYGTTKKFLQTYGLKSLRDLPQGKELAAPDRAKTKAKPAAEAPPADEANEAGPT
jgi:segregation and condensation protein B